MSVKAPPKPENTESSDLIWGAASIAREINRTTAQTYHLLGSGALDGCVAKLGRKTIVASRAKLRALPFRKVK
jgi:hypothetical protein